MIETVALALARTVVSYLAKKIKKNKDVKQFFTDFTSATVNWIRPVFLTDEGNPKEVLSNLISDPDRQSYQESLKVEIARSIKENPKNEDLLKLLVYEIYKKEGGVSPSYTVNQKHSGAGDNIGRDKVDNNINNIQIFTDGIHYHSNNDKNLQESREEIKKTSKLLLKTECLLEYAQYFSIKDSSSEDEIEKFLSNIKNKIKPQELITRMSSLDFKSREGGKYITMFKHKVDDLILIPKSTNLINVENSREYTYKKFIRENILSGKQARYLIISEAGGGKTTLSYFMMNEILKSYSKSHNNGESIISIYIPFYLFRTILDISNPYFFAEIYTQLEKIKDTVHSLIQNGQVCMIFDGLDELFIQDINLNKISIKEKFNTIKRTHGEKRAEELKNVNISKVEEILDWLLCTYQECPIIMTSRIHFYDKRIKYLKDLRLRVLQLKPFSTDQQFKYIQSRLKNNKDLAYKTVDFIKNIPSLYDLSPTPVLLEMIVNIVILEGDKKGAFINENKIKKTDIYKKIVKEWCKQHLQKVKEKWEKDEKLSNRNDITENIEIPQLSELLMIVSLAMFNNNERNHGGFIISKDQIFEYLTKTISTFDEKLAKKIVNSMSAIFSVAKSRNIHNSYESAPSREKLYTFGHKTILEFLVANSIFNSLVLSDSQYNISLTDKLAVPIDFHDDGVVKFINELAQENRENKRKSFRRLLTEIQRYSEIDSMEARVVRNNLIKIISSINNKDVSIDNFPGALLGFDKFFKKSYENLFCGVDCSEIKLHNINFAGQNFQNAKLRNAMLLGAGLSNTNLRNADFENANLTAAYLGQSNAVWSFKKYLSYFILDDGSGNLSLLDDYKGKRPNSSSTGNSVIWDINFFEHDGKSYSISSHQENTFSIHDIHKKEIYLFQRSFNESLFTCHSMAEIDKLFFAGSRGNIYVIDNLEYLLENKNPSEILLDRNKYRREYPESFRNKHHTGTIFGLTSSICNRYLFSCGSDGFINCWDTSIFQSNPSLNSDIKIPITKFELYESNGNDENRFRKLISIVKNNKQYLIAGTQQGWLVILEANYQLEHVKLNEILIFRRYHTDWILDISFLEYKNEFFIITVSGDHSAKVISLDEILNHKCDAEPIWRKDYETSLLSICVDRNNNTIYFGAYDGVILKEHFKSIYEYRYSSLVKGYFWKSSILKSAEEAPCSLIKDVKGANFSNVSGLNRGRMLLLQNLGATVNKGMMTTYYKNQFITNRMELMEMCITNVSKHTKGQNLIEALISDADLHIAKITTRLTDTKEYISNLQDFKSKSSVIELYQEFSELKVTLASLIMVYYWIDKNSINEDYAKTSSEDNSDYRRSKNQMYKEIMNIASNNSDIQKTFESMVNTVRSFIEDFFSVNGRENMIFHICYSDYKAIENLRKLCDYIAGKDTNQQFPSEITNLKIPFLWTDISNSFWTGSSHIAQTYFTSFVKKVFKCCESTQLFLIENIYSTIRKLIKSTNEKIKYHDFATGYNGTIIVGVYEKLTKEERRRVIFSASDSSEDIVSSLQATLRKKGLYGVNAITVEVRNLASLTHLDDNSYDIITQNLGGHHLPEKHLRQMYNSFYKLIKRNGFLGLGDVMMQQIKILAGLPDDVGAPEFPYDVRDLTNLLPMEICQNLSKINQAAYPEFNDGVGFYTMQIYKVKK